LKVADPMDFPAKVRRPNYSVLENAGLKSIKMNVFRPWQEGLKDYLAAPDREEYVA
jgi:dTDP-4-dehydrorhamnose reductase